MDQLVQDRLLCLQDLGSLAHLMVQMDRDYQLFQQFQVGLLLREYREYQEVQQAHVYPVDLVDQVDH